MRTRTHKAATLAGAALLALSFGASAAHASPDPGGQPTDTIIGGQPTDNPWMVQLVFKQGTGTYGCSGEAVSADWVLTAQHCVKGTISMNVYYSNDVKNRGPAIAADKMIASPKGDVALVHLSQSHQLSDYGHITAGYQPTAGDQGEIQGYGLMANKTSPTHLNKASVEVLGSSLDAFFGNAVHIQGIDGGSNHGDSGGPLLIDGVIVGVCSTGDTADPGDNIHATSNYANLTASLPWIEQNSGVKPGDNPAPQPTNTPTPAPTDTPSPAPTDTPTDTPTDNPTTPSGDVNDDTFTMNAGQTYGKFDALANDSVPDGSRVTWWSLPAGPSLYVRGNSDGTLSISRGSYMRGTYTCYYTVDLPDGTRKRANVTLVLR